MPIKGEAMCYHCDSALESYDVVEVWDEPNGIGHLVVGTCPICGRQYQWEEVFEYVGYKNVQEVAEDAY